MVAERRHRAGSALVIVLVFTTAISIAVFAILGYVGNVVRQASAAVGRDVCRLAAQSGVEVAKSLIYTAFSRTVSAHARIVGAGLSGAGSTSSFDWFTAYSGPAPKLSVGSKDPAVLPGSATINGCAVRLGVVRVEHVVGEQFADVTIVAEASRTNPGGSVSRLAVAETVRFAQARSKVFNNAYFVNNYGWFQGSGCTANGDVRANGDMYLDSSCKVNGNVYASVNEELGVPGNVTSHGVMDKYDTYKNTTYGTSGSSRPLYINPLTGDTVAGGYMAPRSVSDADLHARVKANQARSVEMPYIGDISSNQSLYRAWAQELHDKDPNLSTIRLGENSEPIFSVIYDGVGPSGLETVQDSHGRTVRSPDYGALVLVGTPQKPIVVNGPVIVPNDVIISGYVKGQGTIYSGRNIHIVGDIKYVDPPTWEGKMPSSDNSSKDMLGLMAKGNIVFGDCTDSSWISSIRTYLTTEPFVQQYACDESDIACGYPLTFGGSYEAVEHVSAAEFAKCSADGLADFVPGGYDSATGRFGKLAEKTVTLDTWHYEGRKKVYDTMKVLDGGKYNRRYYDTVCADSEISSRCSTITRIDAVLYNNHGIFGRLGKCTINGSLVCRNEGIRYDSKLYLNWDIRLYSGSSEAVDNDRVGLAKGSDNAPAVLSWIELPDGYVDFGDGEGE